MSGIEVVFAAAMPMCLVISAVCSASETAFFSLTQADRFRLRKSSPGAYAAVSVLLASPRSLLIAVLVGNVTINSMYYVLASGVGAALFAGLWLVVFGIVSLVTMIVLGEVLPKSIAAVHRVPLCRVLARPVLWWFLLIKPLHTFAGRFIIAPLVRVLAPDRPGQGSSLLSSDELAAVLDHASRAGVIGNDEQRLMGEVVRLSAVRVREIMTPRVDVQFLSELATAADMLDLIRSGGHSKFPVCRGELTSGSVVGFIAAQKVLSQLSKDARGQAMPIAAFVEPVKFVPDASKLDQLLVHFRATRTDMAMCVNEAGELTGLVQLDAVIAELVGVGVSAASIDPATPQVRMIGLGEWEVPGRLGVRDWAEFFGDHSVAADRRVTTVGGIIIAKLGRLPRPGDECILGGLKLRVESMEGRMVDRVIVALADAGDRATPGAAA
jgi:CBS domain containing-hemolysin-like protein